MNRPSINNLNCAVLRRSSSATQGTSIGNQGKTIEACIAEHHLTVVYEEVLEGVSGSVPGNRSDIDRIIEQKRLDNNFTLLLVPNVSRFTRSGASHGSKLLYDLRAAGIMTLFVAEDVLNHDEMSGMYISFFLHAAHETVKAIGRNATDGSTHSYLAGRSPYTRRPPLGLDRMYSLDGKDLHIIRNMPDGTQQMISPTTEEVIRTFARNQKKGVPNHYIKQKNEQVRLVPGDPQAIATVMMIFQRHYLDKLGYGQVAKELNDQFIPSGQGKEWHTAQVRNLLLNPAYLGRGIRYRTAGGIYFSGGAASATPSGVQLQELANSKRVKTRMRAKEHWREQAIVDLSNFLPENIWEAAAAKIEAHLESIADGQPVAHPNRDRHPQSPYLLKGILRSKQGGHPMCGRPGKAGRRYAVSRAERVPKSNNVLANRVMAEPVEQIVLDKLRLIFSQRDVMKAKLRKLIAQHQQPVTEVVDVGTIQKQIQRKRRQLAVLVDDITGDEAEDDAVLVKRKALRAELKQLESQLSVANVKPEMRADPAMAIERLVQELAKFVDGIESGQSVPPEDVPYIAAILQLFVTKLVVDLVTKELEMELSLPSWLATILTQRQVGLAELSAYIPLHQTHHENGLILGIFNCDLQAAVQKCYVCRRMKRAA